MDVRPFLHPSILRDIIEFKNALYIPQGQGATGAPTSRIAAAQQYGRIWFKVYKRQFAVAITAFAALASGGIAVGDMLSLPRESREFPENLPPFRKGEEV
jgi:hypothetical protein